ncbi:MAG: ice-binding family protein [Patescibacteria group bacterium]|nr:ice-binding family protein [Patescibacteria group bacterium]
MKIFNKASAVVTVASFVLGLAGPMTALAAGPAAVNLGTAGNFVILAKTGISTTGSTSVVGDLGLSPAAATYITGFALTLPAAGAFSTSAMVTGKVYAPGYADPTPANLTTAVLDMQNAYTDAAGRAPDVTELGAGNIGGLTLAPSVYKWGTGVTIPVDVTLSGGADDVWIFQIAQGLDVSSAAKIVLAGGAQASNIFWVVAGQTTIGTTAVFNGNILDQTTIVLNTGATLNGRALAQAAVTLDASAVTVPSSGSTTSTDSGQADPPQADSGQSTPVTPTPTPTPTPTQTQTQTSTPANQTQTSTSVSSDPRIPGLLLQISELSAILQSLQLARQQSDSASSGGVRSITVNLYKGDTDSDVEVLQQFLISQNQGSAAQALARVGATSYFGDLTRAALAEFQANVGIAPALGNFGPITRAYLSAHY